MENKKYLVVADIHGSMLALDETIRLANEFLVDKIIILGDTFGAGAKEMIEKLNDSIQRTLLIARYINCETWEIIAEDMMYDIRHIYRIHSKWPGKCCF